jgi:hypothetical protein
MVAIILEIEWVFYLTTLPVAKIIHHRRLKSGALRAVGGMVMKGVGNRSTQNPASPLSGFVPVLPRGGPDPIRGRSVWRLLKWHRVATRTVFDGT